MAARDDIEALLDEHEPKIREAFERAVAEINDYVVLAAIEERLRAGDIEGAMDLMAITPSAFGIVADAYEEAFRAGGMAAIATVPTIRTEDGARVVVRFDPRQPQAEEWLRRESSRLVGGLSDGARKAVRAALSDGLSRGVNPRTVALDIVGRKSRATGRRVGGVIGLTPQQAEFVRNAREELESLDPALIANYMSRKRRDRRMDPKIRRALRDGKPLKKDDVDMMVGQYSDSLLKLRGEMIARTETLISIHSGQEEAMRQLVASGAVGIEDVTKTWRSAHDARVRFGHMVLEGQKIPYSETFSSPTTGARMKHPGDMSLGARGEDIIGCRCHAQYRVDYLSPRVRRERRRVIGG